MSGGVGASTGVDLDALLAGLADRDKTRTEADVQSDIKALLLVGDLNLEDPEIMLEKPAPNRRRVDIENGRTVIECKKDLRVGNVREEGIKQLRGYVADRTKELGQRYAGVLTDGAEWRLYHYEQATGELVEVSSLAINAASPDMEVALDWLEGVLSTAELLKPTPYEVERKLGAISPGSRLDLAELRDVYAQCKDDSEVRLKRELWARLLAATFGENFDDDDDLFIEHTYLVLTAEVIAHALMGIEIRAGIDPTELVSGELFRQKEIAGVVEADFFDWPVETQQGKAFVTGLARRLGRFDWSQVGHDVLKVLYESVIDADTRHQLGEYYTPDWLAERVVSEVVDAPLDQRVLDPACGSGTFLFWAVRHYLEAADAAGVSNADAVSQATEHVFGIDLHPVAVTLARVTYLLAIGTKRLQDRTDLSIPVYLGDSIQFGQSTSVLASSGITVYTSDGLELFAQELNFPESVVADAARFDRLVADMAKEARLSDPGTRKVPAFAPILDRHKITDVDDRTVLTTTFGVLCHLHDNRRNHIWGYYVRNLARPLEFSRSDHRVDRLVGNPPWLRYNAMSKAMQASFRTLSKARQIWCVPQVVTSMDLSGLFAVRSCELYLKEEGKFGFVMPASALSRLQYDGFRQGNFANDERTFAVDFDTAWELSKVIPQPFPVPAAVVFGAGAPTATPGPMKPEALWWEGTLPDHHRTWPEVEPHLDSALREVVVADGDYAAPYGALVRQGANLVPRVYLTVNDQPATGLGVTKGKRAIESRRSRDEKAPYSDVPGIKGTVEEQFVYEMVLGESVVPYRVRSALETVVPHDGQALLSDGNLEIAQYPGLQAWWMEASKGFDKYKKATTTRDLDGQINYQSKLTKQFPLDQTRVVYTGRGAKACAAVLDRPRAIVDHALYWLPAASIEEAHYVCAVINSKTLRELVESGLSKGLFGNRNIHRSLFKVHWAEYDPSDDLHQQISVAGKLATVMAREVDLVEISHTTTARHRVREVLDASGINADIDALVTQLLDRDPPPA